MKPFLENHELSSPTLDSKGSYTKVSVSSPNKPINPIALQSNRDIIDGTFRSASPHEFIDKHQTFYNNLFQKMKLDPLTKRTNSTVTKESPIKTLRQPTKGNKSLVEEPASDVNYIRQNILKVIKKAPVKKYKYLMDDQVVRSAIEPRRLMRGLDELHHKIGKIFVHRSSEDDVSFMSGSQRNPDALEKSTRNLELIVPVHRNKRGSSLAEKKIYSNLIKEHKNTLQSPDAVRNIEHDVFNLKDDKLEISFENSWRKPNTTRLPQIRSSSQPRSININLRQQSFKTEPKQKDLNPMMVSKDEIKELELYKVKISETHFRENDPIFTKMVAYVEKGSSDLDSVAQVKGRIHTVHKTKSEDKSQNKVEVFGFQVQDESKEIGEKAESLLGLKEAATDLKDSFTNYNLPTHPFIQSLRNKVFILENLALNQNMCRLLGRALSQKTELSSIVLVNNRVDDESISILMEEIMIKPIELEIFRCINNSFGERFLSIFQKKFFSLGINSLKEVTVDGCKVLQQNLGGIFDVLTGARSRLRYLGLANTGLNGASIKTLSRFIVNSEYLASLDLSCNKISGKTMEFLIEALNQNHSIKHLNLCQNSLAHPDNKIAKMMKDFIASHNELVHVNLASTSMNDYDTLLVIEGIQSNKNMLSAHLEGNHTTPFAFDRINIFLSAKRRIFTSLPPLDDSLNSRIYTNLYYGFSTPAHTFRIEEEEIGKPFAQERIEKQLNTTSHEPSNSNTISNIEGEDDIDFEEEETSSSKLVDHDLTINQSSWILSQNCWICERWKKTLISYNLSKTKKKAQEKDSLDASKKGPTITQNRQSRRISLDLTEEEQTDRPQFGNEDVRVIGTFSENKYRNMKFNSTYKAFEYSEYIPPGEHHYKIDWYKGGSPEVPMQRLVDAKVDIKERDSEIQPNSNYAKNDRVASSKEFIKERSVFADFQLDNEEVLRKAFETDIKRFKLKDLLRRKTELDRILLYLFKNYKTLKSIFLYYSATASYPCMSYERFLDCLEECGVLNTTDFRRHDAVKIFNLTKDTEEIADTSQGSVKRFEFIEALLRIAFARFNPKRIVDVQAETIEKFLNEYIFAHAKNSDEYYTGFRINKIYTLEVEKVLQANIDILEKIFKKKKQLFGVRRDCIQETLVELGISLADKDLIYIFAHSKMTVVDDERDQNKCLLLNFTEFLEFFVRVTDHYIKEGELKDKLVVMFTKVLKVS